jgi:hypothetical protein
MGRTSHAVFPEQGHYANDPEVLASYPPAEIQLDQISDLLNYERTPEATEERSPGVCMRSAGPMPCQ